MMRGKLSTAILFREKNTGNIVCFLCSSVRRTTGLLQTLVYVCNQIFVHFLRKLKQAALFSFNSVPA